MSISASGTLRVFVTDNSDLNADLGLDDPVHLRFKGLDLIMALHTEAQRRCLTWTKGDQRGIQISVFPLKIFGLEPE